MMNEVHKPITTLNIFVRIMFRTRVKPSSTLALFSEGSGFQHTVPRSDIERSFGFVHSSQCQNRYNPLKVTYDFVIPSTSSLITPLSVHVIWHCGLDKFLINKKPTRHFILESNPVKIDIWVVQMKEAPWLWTLYLNGLTSYSVIHHRSWDRWRVKEVHELSI
jgi:hypothetical protein